MASTVPFKLITPSAVAFEGEAELVIATGTEGEIGILPKHAPFLTALKPGVMRANVQENGGTKRLELATGEGFLQALPDRITMIVDAAVGGDAVDRNATRDELNAAVERQKSAGSDLAAWRREQVAIDFANAKLRVSGGAG
ncbi:MAG TPA: ATP synthase F1 subunit epsilon [Candidatus Acidoferrales bacterium]|nr:ATP synthase F1 subunit epsilon [Candidatus Acidoferrales bacterium]